MTQHQLKIIIDDEPHKIHVSLLMSAENIFNQIYTIPYTVTLVAFLRPDKHKFLY